MYHHANQDKFLTNITSIINKIVEG